MASREGGSLAGLGLGASTGAGAGAGADAGADAGAGWVEISTFCAGTIAVLRLAARGVLFVFMRLQILTSLINMLTVTIASRRVNRSLLRLQMNRASCLPGFGGISIAHVL